MAEPPLVTFYNGERTFDRLFTGDSLEELKTTVRSKLGLPASQPIQLTQLRKKRRVDLDDEHDFAAFVRRARKDGGIDVEVTFPNEPEEHPDAPPKKKQRTDAHPPTLPDPQPLRLPEPPPPPPVLPTPASAIDTVQKTLPLLPPVEITPAASTSAAPAAAAAEPVKAKPGRKRKQAAAEEPAASAEPKRRKTKGAVAAPEGAVNVNSMGETSAQGASGATEATSNSTHMHGASSSAAAAEDLQAALREYNERKRGTRTAEDIWLKHVATTQENEAKKKAARRRSSSVSSASASAHEEEPPADNAAKVPRAKNARPKDKDKDKAKEAAAPAAPAPAPQPVVATANEAPEPKARKARWKNRLAEPEPAAPTNESNDGPSTSTADVPPVPAPTAPAIGDAAAVAPDGATTAEALAKALALAHSDAPAAAASSSPHQQQQQPKGDRYRLVPCPICGLRPFHLRYECSVLKGGEPAVRARLETARAKGELVVVGELERWLKRVAEKAAREQAEAKEDKMDVHVDVDAQPKDASSSDDNDDDDASSSDESAKSELLTQPKPVSTLDTVDLDALIRGPGPKRASLVALIPDKSDEEEEVEGEKDSQPEPEPEPAPADGEDDEDAKRLRAIERRMSRGGRATQQVIAHSSSESSDSSDDDGMRTQPPALSAAARSFADLNGPASSQFQAAYRAGDAALSAIAAAERRLSPSVLRQTAADVLVEASEAEEEEEDSSATRVHTPPPQPAERQTQDQVSPITSFTQTPRKEMFVQMDTPRRLMTYAKHHRTPVQKPSGLAGEEEEEEEEAQEQEEPVAKKATSPPPEPEKQPKKKQKQQQQQQQQEEDEEEEEEEQEEVPLVIKEKRPATANARRKPAADKDAKPKSKARKGKDKAAERADDDDDDDDEEEPVKRGRASSVPARTAAAKRETLKKKLDGASAAQSDADEDAAPTKKKKRASSTGPGRPRLSDAVKAQRAEAKEAERLRKAADKARIKAEKEAERARVKAEKDAAKGAKTGKGRKAGASKKAADADAQEDVLPSTSATQESEGQKSRISLPGWATVPELTPSPRGASSGVDQLESSQASPVAAVFPQAQAQTQLPMPSPHISSVDDVGEVDDALDLGEDTPRPKAAASSPGKTLRPSSPVDKPTFLSQRPKLASSARRSDTRGITGLSSFTLSPMQPPKTKPKTPATGKKNAFREAEELAQIGEDDDSDDDSDSQTKKPAGASYAQVPAKHRKAGVSVGRVSSPRKR